MAIKTKAYLWDDDNSTRYNIFNLLCLTLVASIFFTNFIHLRFTGNKIQLTEISFLLLIPFIPYKKLIQHQYKNNRNFILIVLTYLLFDLISSVLSHRTSALVESAGRFYLLSLFIILSYYFSLHDKNALITKLTYALLFSSIAFIALAVLGYVQVLITGWSRYIYPVKDYPYFGSIYRLIGPAISPTMAISILTFLILFLLGVVKNAATKKWITITLALLFICALLTLSKSLVLLVLAVVILWLKKLGLLNKTSLVFSTIIFTTVMVFFTHCIVVRKTSSQAESLKSTIFTSNRVIFQTNNYVVFEANYLAVKRAEISMIPAHPLFGIGTGNFNKALQLYKDRGLFPKKFPNYDPHSTYLGILTENGLFAAIMLLVVFGFIFNAFIIRKDLLTDNFLLALFLIYLIFLIEGIATDIFNFRHLWLLFAVALTYLQKSKASLVQPENNN